MTEASDAAMQGMAAAEAGMNQLWHDACILTFRVLALTLTKFTTDDVWEYMEHRWPNLSTPEPRAMGPCACEAVRLGIVYRTDERVNSRLVRGHARPVRIYVAV